jgi:hypothetical protein
MFRPDRRGEFVFSYRPIVPAAREVCMTPDPVRQLFADAAAHYRAERLDEAEHLFRQVIDLDPCHVEALHRLGVIAHQKERWSEAAELIGTAIAMDGSTAAHHFNLALALHELDRYEQAAESCRIAIRLKPDFVPAYYMLGLSLKDLGRLDEAIAAYQAATARDPEFAEAQYGEGYARLLAGDFAAGWRQFEWRRRLGPQRVSYPQPQWRGEDIAGRTLLIHAEQGLGDSIQFARYVPLAAARGAKVLLEVQPPLVPLLERLPGIAKVIGFGEPVPAFDLQCPVMSLPIALGPDIPAAPYLFTDPAPIDAPSPQIGIVWRGNPEHIDDRRRSMTAEALARCFAGLDVTLVCLQKDRTEAELAAFAGYRLIDAAPGLTDFTRTAAVVAALDLVVSVDTAVGHLAGALGVPCRVLLGFAPDWRWRLGHETSDWYPSLRLIRQPAPGDWDTVIKTIREEGERKWG